MRFDRSAWRLQGRQTAADAGKENGDEEPNPIPSLVPINGLSFLTFYLLLREPNPRRVGFPRFASVTRLMPERPPRNTQIREAPLERDQETLDYGFPENSEASMTPTRAGEPSSAH